MQEHDHKGGWEGKQCCWGAWKKTRRLQVSRKRATGVNREVVMVISSDNGSRGEGGAQVYDKE